MIFRRSNLFDRRIDKMSQPVAKEPGGGTMAKGMFRFWDKTEQPR